MTIIVLHGFADASKLAAAPMYTVAFHASEAHKEIHIYLPHGV